MSFFLFNAKTQVALVQARYFTEKLYYKLADCSFVVYLPKSCYMRSPLPVESPVKIEIVMSCLSFRSSSV